MQLDQLERHHGRLPAALPSFNTESVHRVRFILPCVPTPATAPPSGPAWLHEVKLDGWRLQIAKAGPRVGLFTRGGYDLAPRLPRIVAALAAMHAETAVIDPELVGGDGGFWTITKAIAEEHVAIATFDLVHLDGGDLRPEPLSARKARLADLVRRAAVPCLPAVAHFDNGDDLLRAAEIHGLEGIVSKKRDAPYRSGRRSEWVKVKTAAWRVANRDRWRAFATRSR